MRGTERILEVKRRRSQLVKARIYGLVMTAVAILLAFGLFATAKELKEVKAVNSGLAQVEAQLINEVQDLEYEVKELEAEVEELNSFDNKVAIAMDIENIVREAVGGIESVSGVVEYNVTQDYSIDTDITYVDYVLNKTTGETVRVLENAEQMIVVYVEDFASLNNLMEEIGHEYNLGTERYLDTISTMDGTLLVTQEYK